VGCWNSTRSIPAEFHGSKNSTGIGILFPGSRNIMAKITVPLLPQARDEYDQSQMAQLIQTLEQMIFILNNTYTPVTLGDEEEQRSWFLS